MTETAAAKAPVGRRRHRRLAAHRWFAPALGIWFAALFGLCGLALPVRFFEQVVSLMGLARAFPAAAPPLGETAHLLIAAGLSSVGEIFGLVLGRVLAPGAVKVKHAGPEPQPADIAEEPAPEPEVFPRKPISAFLDLAPTDEATEVPEFAVASAEPTEEPCTEEPEAPAPPVPEAHPASSALAAAPLESLGVVQLSERLALAMQARRGALPPRAGAAAATLAESARALVASRGELAGAPGQKPSPAELLASLRRISGAR